MKGIFVLLVRNCYLHPPSHAIFLRKKQLNKVNIQLMFLFWLWLVWFNLVQFGLDVWTLFPRWHLLCCFPKPRERLISCMTSATILSGKTWIHKSIDSFNDLESFRHEHVKIEGLQWRNAGDSRGRCTSVQVLNVKYFYKATQKHLNTNNWKLSGKLYNLSCAQTVVFCSNNSI